MPTAALPGDVVRGLEYLARCLTELRVRFVVGSGEGARRLGALCRALAPERELACRTETAPGTAVGAAAAGLPVALVVSGYPDETLVIALRQAVSQGLGLLLVVVSHGPDGGEHLPGPGADERVLQTLMPLPWLLCGTHDELPQLVFAGLWVANVEGVPVVVEIPLRDVGLQARAVSLPTELQWDGLREVLQTERPSVPLRRTDHRAERARTALSAGLHQGARIVGSRAGQWKLEGASDAKLAVVVPGPAVQAARMALARMPSDTALVHGAQWSPLPMAELVQCTWRARKVLVFVREAEGFDVRAVLPEALAAGYANALAWHPDYPGIGRVPPVTVWFAGPSLPSAAAWEAVLQSMLSPGESPRLLRGDAPCGCVQHEGCSLELSLRGPVGALASLATALLAWAVDEGLEAWMDAPEPSALRVQLHAQTPYWRQARGGLLWVGGVEPQAPEPGFWLTNLPPEEAVWVHARAAPELHFQTGLWVLLDALRLTGAVGLSLEAQRRINPGDAELLAAGRLVESLRNAQS